MQSIILSSEIDQALEYIKQSNTTFLKTNTLDQLNIVPEPSIGIDAVRAIQSFLRTPPLKSSQKRILVMDAKFLTIEAQNSLLKILEEPPQYAQIVLISTSLDSLLPTIQSRCEIISVSSEKEVASSDAQSLAAAIESATMYEKINLSQKHAKTREMAIFNLENLLKMEHENMKINPNIIQVNRTQLLFTAISQLQSNANSRMVLEHVFFNW